MKAAAEPITPNYARDVNNYMLNNSRRQNSIVPDPINEDLDASLPQLTKSVYIESPSDCNSNVQCDLMYDSSWDFRLRAELSCEEAKKKNPCYGTHACLCSNGYYHVSSSMPKPVPSNYSGNPDWVSKYQQEQKDMA